MHVLPSGSYSRTHGLFFLYYAYTPSRQAACPGSTGGAHDAAELVGWEKKFPSLSLGSRRPVPTRVCMTCLLAMALGIRFFTVNVQCVLNILLNIRQTHVIFVLQTAAS